LALSWRFLGSVSHAFLAAALLSGLTGLTCFGLGPPEMPFSLTTSAINVLSRSLGVGSLAPGSQAEDTAESACGSIFIEGRQPGAYSITYPNLLSGVQKAFLLIIGRCAVAFDLEQNDFGRLQPSRLVWVSLMETRSTIRALSCPFLLRRNTLL
jgi:hypothetical protein